LITKIVVDYYVQSSKKVTESGIQQGHGLGIPYEYALRDVYHLLAIFGASPWFDSLPEGVQKLRSDFQECEVRRLLLTISVMVRNSMDSHGAFRLQDLVGFEELRVTDSVGVLELQDSSANTSLTLRDASNKILHAQDITFDYQADKRPIPPGSALSPRVFAYGENKGEQWKAQIDIVKFCDLALYVL